jgi:hypothetical protein
MKTTIQSLMAAMLVAASTQIHAQGLVYDQQSATGPVAVQGNGNADGLNLQEDQPLYQSFIPSLSAIGFVQLELEDILGNGNNGATVYVDLWTGSSDPIRATTLVGSTAPVYMPNGFMNDGIGGAGITNFYFSTPITLTVGQTYYLQPIVQSGDDPWDIIAIGNTYPNGQIFEGEAGFNSDFWFREGVVVPVPEPTTLALVGVSGLLIYAFKRRSKLVVPLLFAATILPAYSAPDSVVQATADAAGLAPASATTLPRTGTFWVMTVNPDSDLMALPYPFLPSNLSTLPIYSVLGNIFIVDDTGGKISPSAGLMSSAQATSAVQAQTETMASLIEQIQLPGGDDGTNGGYQPNGFTANFDTNGLWLSSSNEAPFIGLRAHNTIGGDNYQLLSTTNLSFHSWDLGEFLTAPDVQMDFTPVLMTNVTTFFKVHHANPVMWIQNGQYAIEPNPTNDDPGQVGSLYIYNEGWATNDVPVYYNVGGTSQNGIDYSNLTGVAIVPLNQGYAEIDIDPIADGLKPDQTVILTLLQNTNYLIDPAYDSATNILYANPQVYPTIQGDNQAPCPNMPLTFNLASYVNDPRNLPLSYVILTWPTHGKLDTNDISNANVTYTATNCYEGPDSFTFQVSDGQYDSTGTVTLIITNQLYANPVSAQTCRGMSVPFYLDAGDYSCGEATNYAVSTPLDGSVSNVSGQTYIYTPNGTNFTGTNIFNYIVYDSCGDTATNTVTITVGDEYLSPNSQSVMTGTNQPVSITLSAVDYDSCNDDTNDYTYTLTGSLTNGYLTGTPPNHLTYTPTNGEGMDSFQFTTSDGVWTSSAASVNIYVVAGPILTATNATCYPFGTAVQLDWSLDAAVSNMVQQDGLIISDFVIYSSTNSGGPYTVIYTTTDTSQTNYFDGNAAPSQTNYYVVTFESPNSTTGTNYESPDSNKAAALAGDSDDLIPANAVWQVVTDTNNPSSVTNLQAPFSNYYTNQYETLYPLPNSYWPVGTTWSNHIVLYVPTNVVLSQVQYSIAIDNNYWLYLNNSSNYIDMTNHEGPAVWSQLKSFESVATNVLHWGTNDIGVVIQDEGIENYFSMVVTTNTCGW